MGPIKVGATSIFAEYRPDPQGYNGSAMGLTIPLGPRSREAVKLRRREAIRADVGLK